MMTFWGGVASTSSRTIHVVVTPDSEKRPQRAWSACNRAVTVRPYEIDMTNHVCMNCRKALGWPMITTWESQGWWFTNNWKTGEQTSGRI